MSRPKNRSNSNRLKARKYFGIEDNDKLILHHKDIYLKYNDRKRYDEWRPEDLEVMTNIEHSRLHAKFKETFCKGKTPWNKGLVGCHSEESNKKRSETMKEYRKSHINKGGLKTKGTHWYNNGLINVRDINCPNGFVKGKLSLRGLTI